MIASCCQLPRLSRQVRRIRYTRADVRYVCKQGHGCQVVTKKPKTMRGNG